MQGKLSEIDIRSILQLIELGQRTGELLVEAYPSPGNPHAATAPSIVADGLYEAQGWFVFFLNGQIVYASDTSTTTARLRDYLRRYNLDAKLDSLTVPVIATVNAPEYGYLWALLENHVLTPAQGRSIIHSMVHETLFDLLSLHQGAFVFELGPALTPQLTTQEIAPLVAQIMKQIQEWKQLQPHIQSPSQCPVIVDASALQDLVAPNTFQMLDRCIDGKTSIRQISRFLSRDILTVARAIYPYVQRGVIHLTYPSISEVGTGSATKLRFSRGFGRSPQARPPRIVCIDDGVTIRQTVESILNQQGYEATSIGNPLKALSLVFQLKPDLILCDIAMPELDGYELCAMLRNSTAFREIPIVMLTGKDGFIDRVRARLVGATNYLTKPFGAEELLMLVEKYVGSGIPNYAQSKQFLVDHSKDELEIDRTDGTSTPRNGI